jgi:hypothetical protein
VSQRKAPSVAFGGFDSPRTPPQIERSASGELGPDAADEVEPKLREDPSAQVIFTGRIVVPFTWTT